MHPMIHTLLPKKDNSARTHSTGTVQPWFEEREGELHHLTWPAQASLCSVLETRVRNRFPPPISLKQLEDILQEEWYKILLETVRNLYESISRRIVALLKAKSGPTQHNINKEMCTVSVVFPLFCPILVCRYISCRIFIIVNKWA
jgi:hypothetical protein